MSQQGSLWEEILHAFNPLSLFFGLSYGLFAVAAVADHDYGPPKILSLEIAEEDEEEAA